MQSTVTELISEAFSNLIGDFIFAKSGQTFALHLGFETNEMHEVIPHMDLRLRSFTTKLPSACHSVMHIGSKMDTPI